MVSGSGDWSLTSLLPLEASERVYRKRNNIMQQSSRKDLLEVEKDGKMFAGAFSSFHTDWHITLSE